MSKSNFELDIEQRQRKADKKKRKVPVVKEDAQDQRVRRINFKNYIRQIREQEMAADDDFDISDSDY